MILNITKNITILVIRVDKSNNMVDSKPCLHCCNLMKSLEIKAVVYSNNSNSLTYEKINNLNSLHISLSRRCIGF